MSDPRIKAHVALTGTTNQAVNTLLVPPEERLIIYATGKMFRNGDVGQPWRIPEIFRQPGVERARIPYPTRRNPSGTVGDRNRNVKRLAAIPLVWRSKNEYEYLNVRQGVRFIIRIVEDKDDFVRALQTPGAHVIYDGHARYGRGPCFGPGGSGPGEMWEEGTGSHPNKDGIFRMGFPFIGIEAEEILEHGYTANLAESTVSLTAGDCDPHLRQKVAEHKLKGRTIAEINPHLLPYLHDPDPKKLWWSYGSAAKRRVVHMAGWQNTLSTPNDIGAITPTCRVFSHMGCDSFELNYPVVRKKKNWTRSGNERYAYWTTTVAEFGPAHYFMQHLLTYNKFNAFHSLEESLKYAVQQSNNMLIDDGDPCNIR